MDLSFDTLKCIADVCCALYTLAPLIKRILEWLWIPIYIRCIFLPQVVPESYPKTACLHRIAAKIFQSCKSFALRARFRR